MGGWRRILVSRCAFCLAALAMLSASTAGAQPAGPQLTPPPGGPVVTPPPVAPQPAAAPKPAKRKQKRKQAAAQRPAAPPAPPTSPAAQPPAPPSPAPAPQPQAPGSAAPPPQAVQPAPAPLEPLTLLRVLRTAVTKHPSIAIARTSVSAANADLQLARARFDTTLGASVGHTHEVTPLTPSAHQTVDTTSLGVNATKGFGWGMRVSPQVSIDRIHARDNLGTGVPSDPVQRARLDLIVTQPLLRGAGNTGASSAVRASEHGLRAAELGVDQAAQLQAFDAAVAYWELVAAERELALARASVERAQKLVDDTRTLVEADQRPRGDLRQLEGNLATRQRSVVDATNTRIQRVHLLRLAMGLPSEAAGDWQPRDDFPAGQVPRVDPAHLTELALDRRSDVRAAEQTLQAAEAAYAGADHNTLPALDLDVSVGYAGAAFDDGVGPFFESTTDHIEGVNGGATLRLELPVENSAQESERQRASSQRELARLTEEDLRRSASIQVIAAFDDLRLSAQALGSAMEAEQQYEQARNDERDKLRAGLSTVIDVVVMEDRLIEAQLSRVRTQLSYATALARLRLELGQLPKNDGEVSRATAALLDGEVVNGQ